MTEDKKMKLRDALEKLSTEKLKKLYITIMFFCQSDEQSLPELKNPRRYN